MEKDHRILGSVWFGTTGIVLMNNGHEDKAYIGTGTEYDVKSDEEYIAKYGLPFPLKQAQQLIVGKGEKAKLYETGIKQVGADWYEYETNLVKRWENPLEYFAKEKEGGK